MELASTKPLPAAHLSTLGDSVIATGKVVFTYKIKKKSYYIILVLPFIYFYLLPSSHSFCPQK